MNPVGGRSAAALELRRLEERWRTIRTALRVAGGVAAAYLGFEALEKLGGQNTAIDINLVLNVLAKFEIIIAVALTGSAVAWAVVERYLRRRKTEYLQERVRQLEQRLDPNRTTSGLTTKGKTNPRDIRR